MGCLNDLMLKSICICLLIGVVCLGLLLLIVVAPLMRIADEVAYGSAIMSADLNIQEPLHRHYILNKRYPLQLAELAIQNFDEGASSNILQQLHYTTTGSNYSYMFLIRSKMLYIRRGSHGTNAELETVVFEDKPKWRR